ncbi:biliverdin-producing heme oxygenase [Burkholderia plantarii]|uniref:biliverdin-producing heme oxygenase n=1 Tax=Burkholderia plantarii TaxID=41899 RepID=UPI0018DBDFCE|nr:biliverdin-producing heme oxygenase [Burkholderia plantarii]MBI0331391.1 biliverdin-producing heme oxygenase [Burkholderia plantarii]
MPDEIRQGDAVAAAPSPAAESVAAASTVGAKTVSPAAASAAVPAVLAALRAATGERHERLHQLMPLSAESAGLHDYLAHLRILRAWLAPLEPWLDGHARLAPAYDHGAPEASAAALPPVRRMALIDADLAAAPAAALATLPAGPAPAEPWWPADADAAYRWGARYVIEGSQMGGAVLYNQLHERLAPHPLGFLAAGRHGLSARWKAFVRCLAAEVEAPAAIAAACRGATDAFDHLVGLAARAGLADAARGVPA